MEGETGSESFASAQSRRLLRGSLRGLPAAPGTAIKPDPFYNLAPETAAMVRSGIVMGTVNKCCFSTAAGDWAKHSSCKGTLQRVPKGTSRKNLVAGWRPSTAPTALAYLLILLQRPGILRFDRRNHCAKEAGRSCVATVRAARLEAGTIRNETRMYCRPSPD